MATTINNLVNNSAAGVGLQMGLSGGWWGLSINPSTTAWIPSIVTPNWTITTKQGNNQVVTSKGTFNFWDNGDWKIMYQSTAPGSQPALLVQVHGIKPSMNIVVNSDGSITGTT